MGCFLSKSKLSDSGCSDILGIGLEIQPNEETGFGVIVKSQMDILSKNAWSNHCRTGVWGEELTHFLTLVDSLIAMMNSIVVQFSMKSDKAEQERLAQRNYSKSISTTMCEKVVLGYSALHHLLLYLQS